MKRLAECPICGGSRCVGFEGKTHCFRYNVTRKLTKIVTFMTKKVTKEVKRPARDGQFTFDFGESHYSVPEPQKSNPERR